MSRRHRTYARNRRQRNSPLLVVALNWAVGQYRHHQQQRDQQIQFQQHQELLRQQDFYRQQQDRQRHFHFQQQQMRWQQGMRPWLANVQTVDELLRLSPTEFELAVADVLRAAGYQNVQRTGGAGDRGVDVSGRTPTGEKVVVQCKRYAPGNTVKSLDVQQFIGMATVHHGAQVAIFVTTSLFTAEARSIGQKVSQQYRLYLMDGPALVQWIRQIHAPTRLAPFAPRSQIDNN